jgi:hypothetical protein
MGINISVTAGQDQKSSSATASGSIQHIITDVERSTFQLSDSQLKNAINAYFGKAPNDAFLHSPTPWNDLYKTYNWQQVQMVLVAQNAEILGITSNAEIVKNQELTNQSSKTATFNVSISDSVEDTATSSWSTGGTLSVDQTINYDLKFLGTGVGGSTSLSYSQSWGVGGEHSQAVTVGSEAGVSVVLEAGESVVAELSASRGVMKVRVHYLAYLMGQSAVNYDPTYKGHHFYALDMNNIMQAAKISNAIVSTEDIEIGYYSNSKVLIKDKNSGMMKSTHSTLDVSGR